jgi:hypothetical protein
MSLGYKVCWDDVWVINIITRIKLLSYWTIASLPARVNPQSEVGNIGNVEGIPSLFSILYIWIIASLMNKFVGFMTDIATSIGGGIKASTIANGVKEAANAAMNTKYLPFKHIKDAARKAVDNQIAKIDDKLFDSGKDADQRRKDQAAQDKADNSNKSELRKAAKQEESEYRAKNAVSLSKLSKEDQEKQLSSVRNKAMEKRAAELRISDKDLARLKNDTGFKYHGTNIFGAGMAAAKHTMAGEKVGFSLSKGITTKAMKDDKINTEFSRSEIKSAMKNTDKEGRKALVEADKRGDIKVAKSKVEKAGSAISNTYKAGKTTIKATIAAPVVVAVGSAYLAKGAVSRISGNKDGFKQAKTDFLKNKVIDNNIVKPLATETTAGVEKIGKGLEVARRTTTGVGAGLVAGVASGTTMAVSGIATGAIGLAGGTAAGIVGAIGVGSGIIGGTLGGLAGGVVGFGKAAANKQNPLAGMADGIAKGVKKGFSSGFDYNAAVATKIAKGTIKLSDNIAIKPATAVLNSEKLQAITEYSKSQLQKSHDIVNDSINKDYNEAAKQLEDQGKIDRFAPGTAAFGRSDEEKAMIKKQVAKNKSEQEVKKTNYSSNTTTSYLQKRAEIEDAKSSTGADKRLGIRDADSLATKIFGREKLIAAPITSVKKYLASDAKAQVKEARRKIFETSTKTQLDRALQQRDQIKASQDAIKSDPVAMQQLRIQQQNNDQKISQLQKADTAIKGVQDVQDKLKSFGSVTSPEIKKAQDEYKDLDGSAEAYQKYADKYEKNNFNQDLERIVLVDNFDDAIL